jgi:hypothetical protein
MNEYIIIKKISNSALRKNRKGRGKFEGHMCPGHLFLH